MGHPSAPFRFRASPITSGRDTSGAPTAAQVRVQQGAAVNSSTAPGRKGDRSTRPARSTERSPGSMPRNRNAVWMTGYSSSGQPREMLKHRVGSRSGTEPVPGVQHFAEYPLDLVSLLIQIGHDDADPVRRVARVPDRFPGNGAPIRRRRGSPGRRRQAHHTRRRRLHRCVRSP